MNVFTKARGGVVRTTIPWEQGEFMEGQGLTSDDGTHAWVKPFGARWSDGSVRYTTVEFPAYVPPGHIVKSFMVVNAFTPDIRSPSVHPAVLWGLYQAKFVVDIDGETIVLGKPTLIETTAYSQVWECSTRSEKHPFHIELRLTLVDKCPWMTFGLWITNTDPRVETVVWDAASGVKFAVVGLAVRVRDEEMKVLSRQDDAQGTTLQLLGPGRVADGQGTYIEGVMAGPTAYADQFWLDSADAEAHSPILAVATGWPAHGSYGIFGWVPRQPPWMPTTGFAFEKATEEAMRDIAATVVGDPWGYDAYRWNGMAPNPGRSGDQYPFGDVILTEVARTGNPALLLSTARSVRQEACRPIFFREVDGTLFKTANHPKTWFWTGRPLFINGTIKVCDDSLGKTVGLADWDCHAAQDNAPWWGYDRQHYDPKEVIFFALLTSDRFAMRLVDYYCDQWIANHPIGTGNETADSFEAPRAVDRGHHTGANLWLLTNRDDIKQRLHERVQMIKATWRGQNGDAIKVLEVRGPGYGVLDQEQWTPWEEGMSVRGLYASYLATGDRDALEIAKSVARTVVMYGYVRRVAIDPVTGKEAVSYQMGKNCAWNNGMPLTEAQYNDPLQFVPGDGTDYKWYGLAAALLSVEWAGQVQDGPWKERALEIVRTTLAERTPPKTPEFVENGWNEGRTEFTAIVNDPFSWPAPIKL